jgi:hypothetical protein
VEFSVLWKLEGKFQAAWTPPVAMNLGTKECCFTEHLQKFFIPIRVEGELY